jgi:transposase-like protein
MAYQVKIAQKPAGIVNIWVEDEKVVIKPHCPDCKVGMPLSEFWGDFSGRSYYVAECQKCESSFVVVVHYGNTKLKSKIKV